MQYNHVRYMRRIYTVYKTDFWKVEICCGLPILGSKGREPRKGTFMSSAIFWPPPVDAGKICVDT